MFLFSVLHFFVLFFLPKCSFGVVQLRQILEFSFAASYFDLVPCQYFPQPVMALFSLNHVTMMGVGHVVAGVCQQRPHGRFQIVRHFCVFAFLVFDLPGGGMMTMSQRDRDLDCRVATMSHHHPDYHDYDHFDYRHIGRCFENLSSFLIGCGQFDLFDRVSVLFGRATLNPIGLIGHLLMRRRVQTAL